MKFDVAHNYIKKSVTLVHYQRKKESYFKHVFSNQSFFSSTELEKKQYIFVNMISHYSKIGILFTLFLSVLSNISFKLSQAWCTLWTHIRTTAREHTLRFCLSPYVLTIFEQHHRDLFEPLANVISFNNEPFVKHRPMKWSQDSKSLSSQKQNLSNYLNLKSLSTVLMEINTANDIRFDRSLFDIYNCRTLFLVSQISLRIQTSC